jgi:SAM-dependent methyltransferase
MNLGFLVRGYRHGIRDAVGRLRESAYLLDALDVYAHPSGDRAKSWLPQVCNIVAQYCVGRGLEIGPGSAPYCDPSRTVFADKHPEYWNSSVKIDYVCDAGSIPVGDCAFDYLLSSHCLEHVPDTLRTLEEWCRVLKPGGNLVLVLPHGERTFDCGRPFSNLAHHLKDYEQKVDIYDFTDWEGFERFSVPQYDHRWLPDPRSRRADGSLDASWVVEQGHYHYHVWTQNEFVDVVRYLRLHVKVILEEVADRGDSFLIVASK